MKSKVIILCSVCHDKIYPALITNTISLAVKATCHTCGITHVSDLGNPRYFDWKVCDTADYIKARKEK